MRLRDLRDRLEDYVQLNRGERILTLLGLLLSAAIFTFPFR